MTASDRKLKSPTEFAKIGWLAREQHAGKVVSKSFRKQLPGALNSDQDFSSLLFTLWKQKTGLNSAYSVRTSGSKSFPGTAGLFLCLARHLMSFMPCCKDRGKRSPKTS